MNGILLEAVGWGKNTAQRPESDVQSIFVVVLITELRTKIARLWQQYEELQIITPHTYTPCSTNPCAPARIQENQERIGHWPPAPKKENYSGLQCNGQGFLKDMILIKFNYFCD
jgi:hypothetical protein